MTPEAMEQRAEGERCGTADAVNDAWNNCDSATDVACSPRSAREAYIREAVVDSYENLQSLYADDPEVQEDPVFWRAVIDSYCATLQEQLRARFAKERSDRAREIRADRLAARIDRESR